MKKDILVIGFIILFISIILSGTKIQSVDEYYLTHADDIQEDSQTVWLTIDCSTILDNWEKLPEKLQDEKYVPKDGKILDRTEYVLRPGDTVFDILNRAVRQNKIHMEYQGADKNAYSSVYIQGINHLYEFTCGELSGWMYEVNGEVPNYGCSRYELEDGDEIAFLYTCDMGADIGCDWMGGGQ